MIDYYTMQRRKLPDGRALHCCCMCGHVGTWQPWWSYFGSVADEDDGVALAKFCGDECAKAAGPEAENVTQEMREAAREKEWEPKPPAPPRVKSEREKYRDAVEAQKDARRWRRFDKT